MIGPSLDPVLAEIRLRAKRADWAGVRAFADHAVVRETLEGGLLVGEAEMRQGDTALAKTRLMALLPEATKRRDAAARRRAANMLGAAHFELGELEAAEAAFESALSDATRDEDHLTAARATANLGLIANLRGQHDAALALYRVAAPAYQRLGLAAELSGVSHNIAITLRDQRQYAEAEEQERLALGYAEDARDRRLHAIARTGRAEISLRRGEHAVAEAEATRAAEEFRGLGDRVSEADALRVQALAELHLANGPGALDQIDRAVALAVEYAAPLIQAEALRARAEIRLAASDTAGAALDVNAAKGLFASLGAHADLAALTAWWEEASR